MDFLDWFESFERSVGPLPRCRLLTQHDSLGHAHDTTRSSRNLGMEMWDGSLF